MPRAFCPALQRPCFLNCQVYVEMWSKGATDTGSTSKLLASAQAYPISCSYCKWNVLSYRPCRLWDTKLTIHLARYLFLTWPCMYPQTELSVRLQTVLLLLALEQSWLQQWPSGPTVITIIYSNVIVSKNKTRCSNRLYLKHLSSTSRSKHNQVFHQSIGHPWKSSDTD